MPRLPGPRHAVAGPQPHPLGRLVRRGHPGVRAARPPTTTPWSSAGSRWAARWCCAWPRTTPTASPASSLVNAAVATKRLDVKLLPVLKHLVPSFPGLANDIKKPGMDEHGYDRTPAQGDPQPHPDLAEHRRGPAQDHRSAALPPLDRGPRRRRRLPAADHVEGLLARHHRDPAREQLPRGHDRQRRPEDLRGVRGVHRPRHRALTPVARSGRRPDVRGTYGGCGEQTGRGRRLALDRRELRRPSRRRAPASAHPSRSPARWRPTTTSLGARRAVRPARSRRPCPHPPPVRLAAWLGVFGAPTVLLVALVLAIPLPSLVAYGLVASFVGGFAYLVVHMQRGPRDPGDDGAVV